MRHRTFELRVLLALATLTVGSRPARSQQTAVSVHMVVTVEARHGTDVPVVNREDVMVSEGRDRDQVTGWTPLQGAHSGLELFILIDDASNASLGSQLEDLREFVKSQPESTSIGVGYMRNGTVDVVSNLTHDHALAAHALRLPLENGGAVGSPYLSVEELIKRWPESAVRREILMVSDGIDRLGDGGGADPYVDSAVEHAQRAGIILYAIYATGVGHYGHSLWRINWGQNHLSQVADETGGEAYFLGDRTPISFVPYLDDLAHRLTHQYLLEFLPKPEKKAGMQRVKIKTEVPNAELVAADKVYVPAGL